jgi:tripartite-type tricarboxylate transporter receptor subunit TctC
MKIPRRTFLRFAAGASVLPAALRIARAQTYPTRPIMMVVPYPPGGTTDVVGRLLSERMRASLGQPIIIESVPGANGSIGVGHVARTAPDGYTLVVGLKDTHVLNGAVFALQYDVLKDFEPISLISNAPTLIVAKNAMPANDLNGLVAWLKANPDKASQGTQGVGSGGHVEGIIFQNITGTRFQFVPYRGAAPAVQDLVAGQIDMMFASTTNTLPQVRAGRIKVYAVMAKGRLSVAPDIPTVDEAGLSGLYSSNWQGLWAPKGTPKVIIAKLNAAIMDALADQTVRQRLADLGQEIFPRDQQTPEALGALQKAEIEKWWPIIKAANIKAE